MPRPAHGSEPTRRTVAEHAAAVADLLADVFRPESELVPLADALGRVADEDLRSPVDLPLFRNSQMDGLAVRAAETAGAPIRLPVAATIAAGATAAPLPTGTAMRIMTGAPLPDGADAVVPVERTSRDGGRDGGVVVLEPATVGDYVREPGGDIRRGEVLVPGGTLLAPRHLAALAAVGLAAVPVRRRPRVAVLTTGDELLEPGDAAEPGRIWDANGVALDAACREAGAEVTLRIRASDEPSRFAETLAVAAAAADVILTSGGISQGEFEVVRQVVEPAGGWVGSVAMQPGGPQATALIDGTPVVCFPGNPVSTQVSFAVFVRPLLRGAAGLAAIPARTGELAESVAGVPGKTQFRRGRVDDNGRVHLVAGAGSHLVAAMAAADVLVVVPERRAAGETVEVIPL